MDEIRQAAAFSAERGAAKVATKQEQLAKRNRTRLDAMTSADAESDARKAKDRARARTESLEMRETGMRVRSWYLSAVQKHFGRGLQIESWGKVEQKLVKILLADYGDDLVEKAVYHVCSRWDDYKRRIKDAPVFPTIRLIYGWRASIFAEAQRDRIQKKQDEGPLPERGPGGIFKI